VAALEQPQPQPQPQLRPQTPTVAARSDDDDDDDEEERGAEEDAERGSLTQQQGDTARNADSDHQGPPLLRLLRQFC